MQPRTTTSKYYPFFIRQNKSLKKVAKQQRIFPRIGLDNCEEQINKRRKIVFSGSGSQALWDIATMSMRGVSSCQSWNASHRKHLIGSMADPYCGIIYTTTGNKTSKGSRMSRRAIVRFVVNKRGNPALLIERIYPVFEPGFAYADHSFDKTFQLFKSFLERKTNNKYPVITNPIGYSIPMTNVVANIGENKRSYRDSGIDYVKHPKFKSVVRAEV